MPKGTVNKAIILGRLGADPELKYTPAGKAVVSFSVATNQVWKDANGAKQERTDWIRITAWGKLAEICAEYLRKGSRAYFEGRIETKEHTDDSGIKRFYTSVIVNQMEMLDGKKSESVPAADSDGMPDPADPSDLPF